ncbi:hypothetical protein FB45DRAFT_11170 [Roridomyces roridus]|uniref:BTB domain-containing protein n=1 Tax=Roridomyces roridus TaxID=1738132 RepID=A0AAD7CJD9_9AGAR|nr:hypothetical protein FB45DRAFT_11170 [Roridomyces roridus]
MSSTATQHPVFWFEDGSLSIQIESTIFKIHRTLLNRHSPFLSTNNDDLLKIDSSRGVSVRDFEILLEHLYHDNPLSPDSPFPRIASVLRVSAPGQLDFPKIHATATRYFINLFPSGPAPFLHPAHLEEAFALSTTLNITSVQKGLLYSLVTSTNFEMEEANEAKVSDSTHQLPVSIDSPSDAHKRVLSSADAQRCMRLMTHFIDHFTPILFTPPATPHMACTDVFADTWLKFVIQPALADDGVYKPLETLERLKGLDWAGAGLCSTCVVEKNAEWTEEQEVVWRSMDKWIQV